MTHISADTRCRLIGILAQAVGQEGLAGGQLADLRPGSIAGVQGAADTNRRKTGSLFEAAAASGVAIQNASDEDAAPIHRCAREIGLAYQIWDDLADHGGDAASAVSEDAGKATILSMVGRDATRRRLRAHFDAAVADLRPAGALASYLHGLFGAELLAPELV